jgi:hypothetical protein
MSLRANKRIKDGKAHRYWSVVENRRVRSGRMLPRQILFLSEINDRQQWAWRKRREAFDEAEQRARTLSLSLEGRAIPADALDGVRVKLREMELRRPRAFGGDWLGCEGWQQRGLEELRRGAGAGRDARLGAGSLLRGGHAARQDVAVRKAVAGFALAESARVSGGKAVRGGRRTPCAGQERRAARQCLSQQLVLRLC